jgi:hypothetical protein
VGLGGSATPVNATDARTIAARLGIDETLVRRLQARGYLLSLPLDDPEIRERLLRAHRAYIAKPALGRLRRGSRQDELVRTAAAGARLRARAALAASTQSKKTRNPTNAMASVRSAATTKPAQPSQRGRTP